MHQGHSGGGDPRSQEQPWEPEGRGEWTEVPRSPRTTWRRVGSPCLPAVAVGSVLGVAFASGTAVARSRVALPGSAPQTALRSWVSGTGHAHPSGGVGRVEPKLNGESMTRAVNWQAGCEEGSALGRVDTGPDPRASDAHRVWAGLCTPRPWERPPW